MKKMMMTTETKDEDTNIKTNNLGVYFVGSGTVFFPKLRNLINVDQGHRN